MQRYYCSKVLEGLYPTSKVPYAHISSNKINKKAIDLDTFFFSEPRFLLDPGLPVDAAAAFLPTFLRVIDPCHQNKIKSGHSRTTYNFFFPPFSGPQF